MSRPEYIDADIGVLVAMALLVLAIAYCISAAVKIMTDDIDTALDWANWELENRPRLKPCTSPKHHELPKLPGIATSDDRDIQHPRQDLPNQEMPGLQLDVHEPRSHLR